MLSKLPIEKITVDMIVEKSDLSRSTFYRHFSDKYELINWYFQWNLSMMFEDNKDVSLYSCTEKVFSFLLENRAYFKKAILYKGQNSLKNFMLECTFNFCRQVYLNNKKADTLTEDESLSIESYCIGSQHITQRWLVDELDYSPEDIALLCVSSVPHNLIEYLH